MREIVALHAAPRVIGGREGEPAPGRVAPYPHTFAAVAAVARGLLGLLDDFDRQIAPARPARDLASALRNGGDVRWRLDYAQDLCPDFDLRGTADRQAEALRRLAAIAAKQGSGEALTAAEGDFLRTLSSDRCELRWGLLHVARTCDRFAAVARRQLEGEPLTEDDSALLQNVDRQIADMLAQESSAFRPVVTPVAAHPDGRSVLWMGIAYPAAVYVVLDDAGTPSLFCGAVYDVRALVRPGSAPALTNREWERSCSRPPRATSRDASAPTTAIPEFGMYR